MYVLFIENATGTRPSMKFLIKKSPGTVMLHLPDTATHTTLLIAVGIIGVRVLSLPAISAVITIIIARRIKYMRTHAHFASALTLPPMAFTIIIPSLIHMGGLLFITADFAYRAASKNLVHMLFCFTLHSTFHAITKML